MEDDEWSMIDEKTLIPSFSYICPMMSYKRHLPRNVYGLWSKLKNLYMTKSLANW